MKMKKLMALLMALAMLTQVCLVAPAFAADPVVNVTYRDENGVETQFTVPAGAINSTADYYVQNDIPDHQIRAIAYNVDGRVILEIEGNVIMVSTDEWETALWMTEHTEAHVNGDVSGGVVASNFNGTETKTFQPDGTTLESRTLTPVITNANIQIVGDVSDGASSRPAVTAEGNSTIEITGDVTGGVVVEGQVESVTYNYQDDGITLETREVMREDTKPTVQIVGDVTNGTANREAVQVTGGSTVDITGDVESTGKQDAIVVSGDATVNVTGDVTAEDGRAIVAAAESNNGYTEYYDDTGVYVDTEFDYRQTSPTITIEGNVTSDQEGIRAVSSSTTENHTVTNADGSTTEIRTVEQIVNDATITVDGNVTVNKGGSGYGVDAGGTSEILVDGNVTADRSAVYVTGDSDVHITGDATSRESTAIQAMAEFETITNITEKDSSGVVVGQSQILENPHTNGSVVVDGDVNARFNGIEAQIDVTVGGSVTAENGSGIIATTIPQSEAVTNQAEVTVKGDVTAGYDGISAADQTRITVGGDVTAGHTYKDTDFDGNAFTSGVGKGIAVSGSAEVSVGGSVSAVDIGVMAHDSASVEIGGDLESGHVNKGKGYSYTAGDAVQASGSASVVIDGDVTSLAGGLHADDYWTSESVPTQNEDGTITHVNTYETKASQVSIEVGGDLTTGGEGIVASGYSEVTVGGDVTAGGVGVAVQGSAQVSVEGNIEAEDEGIHARQEELTKSVDSWTWDPVSKEYTENSSTRETTEILTGATVTVGGDVTSEEAAAINMDGVSNVIVWGDVTGGQPEEKEEEDDRELSENEKLYSAAHEKAFEDVEEADTVHGAVEIILEEEKNDGLLIVGGTISSNGDSIPLVVTYTVEDTKEKTEMPELPEIKVYEIAPQGGDYFDVNVILSREVTYEAKNEFGTSEEVTTDMTETIALSEEEKSELIETIAAAIQYIIKIDESLESGVINISDQFYDKENGIYTAHEGEEVSITLGAGDYNTVTATGNYTLTENEDGSWTLTVERGGGVTLSARIEKKIIEEPEETPKPTETPKPEETKKPEVPVIVEQTPPPVPVETPAPAPAAQPAAAVDDYANDGMDDPRIGKGVFFGRYDLNGDGKPEELAWRVMQMKGGYARLALIPGMGSLPGDFLAEFTEAELAAIRDQQVTELAAKTVRWMFGDDKTHPCMEVKLDALNLK